MHIIPLGAHNPLSNYIWLIHDGNHAIVVDPTNAAPVIQYLGEHSLQLAGILLTHRHSDHIAGVPELCAKYHHTIVCGPSSIPAVTHILKDGDHAPTLLTPSINIQVLYTPGHTDDHVSYYINQQHLFCGDVLFSAGCGRIFPMLGGNLQDAYQSIQKIAALPNDTLIYCAHEYTHTNLNFALSLLPNDAQLLAAKVEAAQCEAEQCPTLPTLLKKEKQINLFLRCHEPLVKQALTHVRVVTDNFSTFCALRELRNQY